MRSASAWRSWPSRSSRSCTSSDAAGGSEPPALLVDVGGRDRTRHPACRIGGFPAEAFVDTVSITGPELPRAQTREVRMIDDALDKPESKSEATVLGQHEDICEVAVRRVVGDDATESSLVACGCVQPKAQ